MARYPGILLLLLLVPGVQAAELSGDSRYVEESVDFDSGGRLVMKTFKGSVVLEPWDREQVQVTARIEAPEDVSEDYARRAVEATRVEFRGGGRSLRIHSNYDDVPAEKKWLGSETRILPYVHYEIRAPRRLSFEIKDHKSTMELEGFEGDFELETHKGTVLLKDLAGRLDVNTHKGSVRVEGLVGHLDIDTHKGDVEVSGFEMESDSRLSTHKGRIHVALAASQSLDVKADIGERGDFSASGFELEREDDDGDHRLWRGRLNAGGPSLSVSTYKGNIELQAR